MSDFPVRDPDYAARIRESFARQNFMTTIGADLTDLKPGACEIRLPYRPSLAQQHGFFHGGIVATLADNACGYASYTLMGAEDSVLTVEFKLNLLAPADGELLIARGSVLKPGRTLAVARGDVYVAKGGRETLCASLLGTFMRLANSPDRPKAA